MTRDKMIEVLKGLPEDVDVVVERRFTEQSVWRFEVVDAEFDRATGSLVLVMQ